MRILLLDIETRPNVATVWGLFKQNISINQILESGKTLCWAAKWYQEKEIIFDSLGQSEEYDMLSNIHELIDQADAVIHYNGTRFDMPTLHRDFLLHQFAPPAPYKNIDLLKTVKHQFRFVSNKMDFVCKQLGIDGKVGHSGYELWLKCMNNDPEAWAKMQEYNCHDVEMLERLYLRLMPWIKGHPNRSIATGGHVCPNCGGHNLQRRGTAMTTATVFERFQCQDCGKWSRARIGNIGSKQGLLDIN